MLTLNGRRYGFWLLVTIYINRLELAKLVKAFLNSNVGVQLAANYTERNEIPQMGKTDRVNSKTYQMSALKADMPNFKTRSNFSEDQDD